MRRRSGGISRTAVLVAGAARALALAARNRQLLPYDTLGRLIGVPRFALANLLEPIQADCLRRRIPALTSIVVKSRTLVPGQGFTAGRDVLVEQQRVFQYDWLSEPPLR